MKGGRYILYTLPLIFLLKAKYERLRGVCMKQTTKNLLKNWEVRQMEKSASKFYQYEEEINGTKYIFQNVGKRMAIRMTDEATVTDENGNQRRSTEKIMDLAYKHIVVSPSVSFEYFDEPEHEADFERVNEIIGEFLAGNFRNLGKEN